jgi:hypothetical protein
MDSLSLLVGSLFVAGLITWRLLIGSHHHGNRERLASSSLNDDVPGGPLRDQRPASAEEYPARSLRICNNPCRAALRLRRKVYLADEAPALPLPACDRTCYCEYTEHEDRRIGRDRRHPTTDTELPGIAGRRAQEDLRSGRERRRRGRWAEEPYQGIY